MAGAPVRSRKAERYVSFARSRQAGNLRELQELGSQISAVWPLLGDMKRHSAQLERLSLRGTRADEKSLAEILAGPVAPRLSLRLSPPGLGVEAAASWSAWTSAAAR